MLGYMDDSFIDSIEEEIIKHHQLYPLLPLKAEYWESAVNTALTKNGYETVWEPGSHKVGADIEVTDDVEYGRISVKGGSVVNKTTRPALNISSFRTTKLPTLEAKLNHMDGGHEDVVLSLAHVKPLKKDKFTHKYILSAFFPLKFSSLIWMKTEKGWVGKDSDYSARITRSQSDQLWYKVPLDTVTLKKEFIFD